MTEKQLHEHSDCSANSVDICRGQQHSMKSHVANQSPQYYVKAVKNSTKKDNWDLYEGFMVKGKKHGLGRYTWADSECMLCMWNQGSCKEQETREAEKQHVLQRTRRRTQTAQADESQCFNPTPKKKIQLARASVYLVQGLGFRTKFCLAGYKLDTENIDL
jgi:hypothetical protein